MDYNQKYFLQNELNIKDKNFKCYLSPIFVKNNFKHGFFTKTSSEINVSTLSNHLNLNKRNCVLNQIHSNRIVFGSMAQGDERIEADGIVCDNQNQNLWIYTADCMPILFADKRKRSVAAIHCGRMGLEKRIIKNLINIFYSKGCLKEDILVAIGPSISKKNYLIDKRILHDFYKKASNKEAINCFEVTSFLLHSKNLFQFKREDLTPLNLKKHAYIQLSNENIPNKNIDISNLCTYELNHDFYSWRRSKTYLRQWNFISP